MAESEEELKCLLMKKESEKVGLKLNSQKTKILASVEMTSLGNDSAFPLSPTSVPEDYHGVC